MRLPPVQEFIHWLEVGQGARVLRIIVAVLCVLTVTIWYDLYQTRNFSAPEAMEAAQLARNLARGEGFTTQVVRPLTIQLVEDTLGVNARLGRPPRVEPAENTRDGDASLRRPVHPDLFNPPLYPLLLAGWMKLLPFNDVIEGFFWRHQPEVLITAFNQLLFLLLAWLAYRLARRLLNGEAAVVLVAVLCASEFLWRFSASGLPTMLLLVLFVGLLDALTRLEEAQREGHHRLRWFLPRAAAAGLLLGLLALTRYGLLVLLLPVALFYLLFLGRQALPVLAVTLLMTAVVVTPWLVRNHQLSGTLFGVRGYAIYEETLRFPDGRLERSLRPDLETVGTLDLIRKAGEGLRQLTGDDLLRLGGSWVGAFFLVGLLGQYRNPGLSRLRVFLFLCLPTLALTQALGRTHLSVMSPVFTTENLLAVLTPGVCLVGVAFFFWLIERLELPFPEFRHVLSTVLVLGTAVPLFVRVLPPRTVPVVYPPYYPPYLQEAAGYLEPSELLMTDMPWATAWYGDRTSVWTTMDAQQSFYEINDQHKALSALLLTPLTTDAQFRRQILQSRNHEWSRLVLEIMFRTNVPARFPLTHVWRRGTPDHLFLADRPRWLTKVDGKEEAAPLPPAGETNVPPSRLINEPPASPQASATNHPSAGGTDAPPATPDTTATNTSPARPQPATRGDPER